MIDHNPSTCNASRIMTSKNDISDSDLDFEYFVVRHPRLGYIMKWWPEDGTADPYRLLPPGITHLRLTDIWCD